MVGGCVFGFEFVCVVDGGVKVGDFVELYGLGLFVWVCCGLIGEVEFEVGFGEFVVVGLLLRFVDDFDIVGYEFGDI